MDTQTPKAASSKSSTLRVSGHGYPSPSADALITESGIDRSAAAWHRPMVSRDGPLVEETCPIERGSRTEAREVHNSRFTYPPPPTPPTTPDYRDYPEELAQMIISMPKYDRSPEDGEERAEAFRGASNLPPITKQSLSELDIQNIITNIKLRHDVNFDRDLSFRPNMDGAKGEAKQMVTHRYWVALAAELELYDLLFQGTPTPESQEEPHRMELSNHAKRRIPVMFRTVQEVLKSLVPDRDHLRVDEHLDVPMLMQEIERGVCDLTRLAEWMAQLLKEHCAPMRDGWVDEMVSSIRDGVTNHDLKMIVDGLRTLLAILETMKLVRCLL